MKNNSTDGKERKKSRLDKILDSIYEIFFNRYKGTELQKKDIADFEKEAAEHIYPRTKRGTRIRFLRIPKYENNVLAFVYFGAAILVLVLGFRGLGTQFSELLPGFLEGLLTDTKGRLTSGIIFPALILECFMIAWLAATMFFKVEEHDGTFSLLKRKKTFVDGRKPSLLTDAKQDEENKESLCEDTINLVTKDIQNLASEFQIKDQKLLEKTLEKVNEIIHDLVNKLQITSINSQNGKDIKSFLTDTVDRITVEIHNLVKNFWIEEKKPFYDEIVSRITKEISDLVEKIELLNKKLLNEETEEIIEKILNLTDKKSNASIMSPIDKMKKDNQKKDRILDLLSDLEKM